MSATRERALPADPRPHVAADADGVHRLEGSRCVPHGHAVAGHPARCPRCGGELHPEHFGPGGTVWACTVVHVAGRPGEALPYTLAYVDLDDGPRVMVRLGTGAAVGARVELTSSSPAGDPTAQVLS